MTERLQCSIDRTTPSFTTSETLDENDNRKEEGKLYPRSPKTRTVLYSGVDFLGYDGQGTHPAGVPTE